MKISFPVLMRDWLKENFPQYKVGQAYEIIGIFLPGPGSPEAANEESQWRWGGGKWVASIRLDGATKFSVWHRPDDKIIMHHLDMTDHDVFTKLQAFLATAKPRQVTMWMWDPIEG